MIIYIDLVFLLNFFGDYLCLWLSSTVYRRISVGKRVFSAFLGGLYGVAAVLPELSFLTSIACKLLGAAILAAVAYFPANAREILRAASVFCMSSMLLCGGVELAATNLSLCRLLLAVFGCACLLVCGVSLVKSRIYSRYLPCELCYLGKKVRLNGFYDSGNRLFAGDDGASVIIADERVLKKLFSPQATPLNISEWADGKNLVPVSFSGAAGGVMQGIILDYAKIDGRRYENVILAISENRLSDSLVLHSTMV
ncbi:MAG: sigma-E processing peptidase SpoIIGA [Clostridia bacterium]|nr:sigma-E processing peptidase SpoIIGA [Clostridia bacterium]